MVLLISGFWASWEATMTQLGRVRYEQSFGCKISAGSENGKEELLGVWAMLRINTSMIS